MTWPITDYWVSRHGPLIYERAVEALERGETLRLATWGERRRVRAELQREQKAKHERK